MNPQRIIAFPYSVWIAKQGLEFPKIGETEAEIATKKLKNLFVSPSAEESWKLFGTSGARDYSEAGVTITHTQTIATFQGAGSTWVRKAWRSDEAMQVSFDLADLSPTGYAEMMDKLKVEEVTGSEANQWVELNRGLQVTGCSLLLRGISSLTEGKNSQYEIPYAYQAGNPAPKFAIKGGPALLACQFVAVEADDALPSNVNGGARHPILRVGK